MDVLTLKQILDIDDIKRETIEIPEWGGSVEVKELSAEQKLIVGAMVNEPGAQQDANKIVQVMITSAAFGLGASIEQVHEVGAKSYGAIERVAQCVLKLSGMESVDGAEDPKKG